jgi:hypothetical protein
MWSLLDRRAQLTIVIGAGVCIAWALDAAYGFLSGHSAGIIKWISLAVLLVSVVLVGIAEAAWKPLWRRFPILQRKTFPDFTGTWKGTLTSTWIDPATGAPKEPIPTEITIRQGLFATTSVSLKTGESSSHSTRSLLEPFREERRFRIWYSYNNDPQAQFQHRSSPHEGVAFLDCEFDSDPDRLAGRYYTARRTTGDIEVRRQRGRKGKR